MFLFFKVYVFAHCAFNNLFLSFNETLNSKLGLDMVYIHLVWLYRNLRTPQKNECRKLRILQWKNLLLKNSEMGSIAKRLNNALGHRLCLSTLCISIPQARVSSGGLRYIVLYLSCANWHDWHTHCHEFQQALSWPRFSGLSLLCVQEVVTHFI